MQNQLVPLQVLQHAVHAQMSCSLVMSWAKGEEDDKGHRDMLVDLDSIVDI